MGKEKKHVFFPSPQPPYDTKRPLQRIEIQKDSINIPHVAKFVHLLIFASNVDFAGIPYLGRTCRIPWCNGVAVSLSYYRSSSRYAKEIFSFLAFSLFTYQCWVVSSSPARFCDTSRARKKVRTVVRDKWILLLGK